MRSRIIINYSQVDCDGLWLGPVKPLDDTEVIYVQSSHDPIFRLMKGRKHSFLVCSARSPGGRPCLDTPLLFTMKLLFLARLYQ